MKKKTSNTLRINFYPCYERFCRKCVDGTCTDEETYKKCEFGADNVAERMRKKMEDRKKTDCCGNCFWFDGEMGDGTQFCDVKQREVNEGSYCQAHKRKLAEKTISGQNQFVEK